MDATAEPQQTALQALLRVIASRDRDTTSRLLAESPALARLCVTVGATRQAADGYFLEEIGHYIYVVIPHCTWRRTAALRQRRKF